MGRRGGQHRRHRVGRALRLWERLKLAWLWARDGFDVAVWILGEFAWFVVFVAILVTALYVLHRLALWWVS